MQAMTRIVGPHGGLKEAAAGIMEPKKVEEGTVEQNVMSEPVDCPSPSAPAA
jgi:hypothetical protein